MYTCRSKQNENEYGTYLIAVMNMGCQSKTKLLKHCRYHEWGLRTDLQHSCKSCLGSKLALSFFPSVSFLFVAVIHRAFDDQNYMRRYLSNLVYIQKHHWFCFWPLIIHLAWIEHKRRINSRAIIKERHGSPNIHWTRILFPIKSIRMISW